MNALREFLSDGGDMEMIAVAGACLMCLIVGLYQRWRDR